MNNIKLGIRNIWVNKSISAINILGLSLGISAFVIILLWVENEYGYNKNVHDRDQIASIMVNQSFESGEIQTYAATPPPLAKKMLESVKGVSSAASASWGDQIQFIVGDNKFTEFGLYASMEFIDVFSVELIKGQKENALKKPNTILISDQLAEKYFKKDDPLGKTIQTGNNVNYVVTGVFKSSNTKVTLRYNFIMPLSDYFNFNPFMINDWSVNNVRTYAKFDKGTDFQKVNVEIKTLLHQQSEKQKKCDMFLFPMKDWYLRGEFKDGLQVGGRIKYVRLFSFVALIILLLSCVNFVNMSTAGATHRLKEIGVRKSLGADRWTLIKYFILESITLAIISGVIALGIIYVALPIFNAHFDQNLDLGFSSSERLIYYFGLVTICGILAGFYPSIVLSGMEVVNALKKTSITGATNTTIIRKALVTGQFTITILLITGSIIVTKQLDYFHNKDLGVDDHNLLWFPSQIPSDKLEAAMIQISNIKGVKSTATSSSTFQGSNNRGHDVSWPGKKLGNDVFFNFIAGSHDLPSSLGLNLSQGRSFSKEFSTDTSTILINETAAKQMNLKDPVGQSVEIRGMSSTIIGVLSDFHFESLHSTIGPLIVQCRPDWTWLMYVKLDGSNNDLAIKSVEEIYHKFAPEQIFEYNYQKDQPQWFYRSEGQTSILIKWFSGFAVFLSCLGLLGLTIFSIEKKKKEIGIRKVLGANLQHLLMLVYGQFIILLAIAILLSLLPSYYFTTQWLKSFPYNIKIEWYDYIFGPILAFVMAIMSMSFLVIKAALMDPVKSLKTE